MSCNRNKRVEKKKKVDSRKSAILSKNLLFSKNEFGDDLKGPEIMQTRTFLNFDLHYRLFAVDSYKNWTFNIVRLVSRLAQKCDMVKKCAFFKK